MKIVSYNVNGIRAAIRKGFLDWLHQLSPDVVCLQEIKADKSVFPHSEIEALGYHTYIHPAKKKGYSGVAILCKQKPDEVVEGTGIEFIDHEGRVIRARFGDVWVSSLYLPSGTNTDRLELKFHFMDTFTQYVDTLLETCPKLVICGDYNICHHPIDIHDPVRNKNVSGFLPEERAWLSEFMQGRFVDTFRQFNTEPHQYSWWSYRANARANNKGWRIDYCMASLELEHHLSGAGIQPQAMHSDHCPIYVDLKSN